MNRIIELRIIDGEKNERFRFYSDGSSTSYHISFEVKKDPTSSNDLSSCTIINLSRESISTICSFSTEYIAQLYVGHDTDKGLTLIASGNIMQCIPTRNYTETRLQIFFFNCWYVKYDADVSQTIAANRKLKEHVYELAKLFQQKDSNVNVSYNNIEVPDIQIEQSISYAGKVKKNLDRLAMQYKFSWSIHENTFVALKDGRLRPSYTTYLASTDFNLLACTPSYMEYSQYIAGVNLEIFLEPNICPCDQIELKSSFYEEANGLYVVQNIQHVGSTFAPEWKTILDITTPPTKKEK